MKGPLAVTVVDWWIPLILGLIAAAVTAGSTLWAASRGRVAQAAEAEAGRKHAKELLQMEHDLRRQIESDSRLDERRIDALLSMWKRATAVKDAVEEGLLGNQRGEYVVDLTLSADLIDQESLAIDRLFLDPPTWGAYTEVVTACIPAVAAIQRSGTSREPLSDTEARELEAAVAEKYRALRGLVMAHFRTPSHPE